MATTAFTIRDLNPRDSAHAGHTTKKTFTYNKIGKGLANNDCIAANKAGAFTRNDDFIARATPLWRYFHINVLLCDYLYAFA